MARTLLLGRNLARVLLHGPGVSFVSLMEKHPHTSLQPRRRRVLAHREMTRNECSGDSKGEKNPHTSLKE